MESRILLGVSQVILTLIGSLGGIQPVVSLVWRVQDGFTLGPGVSMEVAGGWAQLSPPASPYDVLER